MIKFTVVTCTYNAASVLQRTLDSIQRQTYCNIEHIIMDGGSKDKTLSMVKTVTVTGYPATYKEIKSLDHNTLRGGCCK